jgi:hypothetical protein
MTKLFRRLAGAGLLLLLLFGGTAQLLEYHSRARAAEVIRALEQYRGQYGHYPAELTDLVPAYLPWLPRPAYWPGRPYDYQPLQFGSPVLVGPDYELSYRQWLGEAVYNRLTGRWED